MNVFNSFKVLIVLSFERGACQSLTCGQSDVPTLGQNFELYCTVTEEFVVYYDDVILKKTAVNFMQIPMFDANDNATFFDPVVRNRLSAVVTVTSASSRTVTVKFSTLECIDNGVYTWETTIEFIFEIVLLTKEQTITAKVIPQFGSNYGCNITYSPATNLVEGDTVTFTCQGDVGNSPIGNLLWFYYLNGSTTAVDVSGRSTAQSPLDSTVAGRTCSKTRVSTLTLTLTKEMHWFVVRCTVNQDQPLKALGQGYQMTQPIDVMYKPTISSLRKVPDAVQYTDGDALLTLTCTATSNPAPEYYWTYESVYTNRTHIGTGNQLVLRNLTLKTTGVYTCVAYNLIKGVSQTTNASTFITVGERTTLGPTSERPISTTQVYKPHIISLTRDPEYEVYVEGLDILTLTCVASGNPFPSCMWIFQSGYDDKGTSGSWIRTDTTTSYDQPHWDLHLYGVQHIKRQQSVNLFERSCSQKTAQTTPQTKSNDAIVIGATFGVTLAASVIILAIVYVVIGRRHRCVKRQDNDNGRNVRGAPATVEFDEYQTTPYYSSPRMYETLERKPDANEPYTQLESAGGHL